MQASDDVARSGDSDTLTPDGAAQSAAGQLANQPRNRANETWLIDIGPSENAERLLRQIADAGAHGLNPARYDLDGLHEALAAAFERPPFEVPGMNSPERAALTYRFNRAFTRLATDLAQGILDARTIQRRFFRDRPTPDIAALQAELHDGAISVDEALRRVAPTHERYLRLVETSRKLLDERTLGGTRTPVDDSGSLWVGHHHDDVMQIKQRLIETGDLPRNTVLTPMFDADLVVAMEAFQARHGIPRSGVVDLRTRTALNRTLDEDLDAIAMSLERWRWMPRKLGKINVFVNLPDYRLVVDNGTERVIDMPVVVGAVEHATPNFSRDMSYLEFNPTWTVPASIAGRELLPRERRNPGYLKSRNFDYLKVIDGKLRKVPYDSITRADLSKRPFPYMLRQRGGDNNALGNLKFMMPNPYAIYLHDTQAQRHFTLHDRAYSHGCIRVSDPEQLASALLQIDGRSRAYVQRATNGSDTRRVSLRSPIPTHLTYFTTWIDDEGNLQRRADVYEQDAPLHVAMRNTGALPSARFGTTLPPG